MIQLTYAGQGFYVDPQMIVAIGHEQSKLTAGQGRRMRELYLLGGHVKQIDDTPENMTKIFDAKAGKI